MSRTKVRCTRTRRKKNDLVPISELPPPEIIMEILSWLPLKPLVRSQVVSKEWQALTLSHKFMEKHMKRSKCIHHFYNVETEFPDRGTSFCFLHGLDGLILMRNWNLNKYILWNPAARRVLELPDPLGSSDGNGLTLSVIPATRSYTIVYFFKDKKSTLLGCQVLTLGKALAWRQLTLPFSYTVTGKVDNEVKVVPLGRAVHCVVHNKVEEEAFVEVITLDVETESFTLTCLGTDIFRDVQTTTALEWNGKIAFYDIVGQDMELMVLEDYKKLKWCKEEVIPLPFLGDEGFKGKTVRPLFCKEGKIWFSLQDVKIFTYTIETRKTIDIEKATHFAFETNLYTYKPSFIVFEGMQSDEELNCCRPSLCYDD